MLTVKKFNRGFLKGFNIRKTKDGKFHPYLGIVSQHEGFLTLKECEEWLKCKYLK